MGYYLKNGDRNNKVLQIFETYKQSFVVAAMGLVLYLKGRNNHEEVVRVIY